MAILKQREFESRLRRTEKLIESLESIADEESKGSALAAVQALLDLHGDSLDRMMEILYEGGPAGQELMQELGRDQMVGGLLLLHGLHPRSLEARVELALERVRPYLDSHGGNVDLVGIRQGVVHLRLEGSCHGCASSAMTLKYAIETEIMSGAPDVVAIEVEGAIEEERPPAGFVPLARIGRAPQATPASAGWQVLNGLPELVPGQLHVTDVDGGPILLCKLETTLYAYRAVCPSCSGREFTVAGEQLTCAGCSAGYDVRHAGRSLDASGRHLEPLPLLVEAGAVSIASGV